MDTGDGKFVQVDADNHEKKSEVEHRFPNHGGWFREGEVIEIRGSSFRIQSVKPTQLRLKLLAKASA